MNTVTTSKIIANLNSSKEFQKNLKKLSHYSNEQFLKDALQYIKAIKERRMLCNIISVSNSGMSRNIKFMSCEKNNTRKNEYWHSNYNCLFIALGYTRVNDGFRINGCGMDMVFHTNYSIIHNLKTFGILNKKQCATLCQMTPTVI